MKRPLIIAHRGEPGRRENTVAGFLAGIRRGAEWIELDVHRTRDGAIVVHHDFDLGGRAIARLTLKQAKQRARRVKRLALPTLDEVLEALPERIGLGVEIKAPGIGAAVLQVLTRHRAVGRALVNSFHWPTIRALAERRPRVRTGLLTCSRLLDPLGDLRRARAHALCQEHTLADRQLVRAVHRAGLEIHVWTANAPADLRRMMALGVDGIITDYPARLRRLLKANV